MGANSRRRATRDRTSLAIFGERRGEAAVEQVDELRAEPIVMGLVFESHCAGELEGQNCPMRRQRVVETCRQLDMLYVRTGFAQQCDRVRHDLAGRIMRLRPVRRGTKADAGRGRQRLRVQRVAAENRVRHQCHVGNRTRQDAEIVERSGLNLDALHGQNLMRRHVADNAAIRGWPYRRTDSLRADSDRHHEIGDGGRRSRRRAAGRVFEIMRIGGAPRRYRGKFRRDGLAEDDRAGPPEHCYAGGIGSRDRALVDRGAMLGRHVMCIDNVLYCDRNAVKRARRWLRVRDGGLRQRILGGNVIEGTHIPFAFSNSIETRFEIVGDLEGAVFDHSACCRRIVPVDARDLHRTCLPRSASARNPP